MTHYTIRQPHSHELQRLVDFIAASQAQPETRCLHVDWTPEGILADVQDLNQPFTEAFRLACEGDTLVGVLGCDLDLNSGRGWLHGPFAREDDWERIVSELFSDRLHRLPAEIGRLSNYLELSFARGLDFHARLGFVRKGISHIYRAERQSVSRPPEVTVFEAGDADGLLQLHERAFPQTWISGADMIAKLDKSHPVLVARREGQLAGYIRLSQHVSLPEGTVDFVAVNPDFRGAGLGRALLLAGLDWIFNQRGLETAFLNVSDDNANARKLYESAGFNLFQSGVALDWWRGVD